MSAMLRLGRTMGMWLTSQDGDSIIEQGPRLGGLVGSTGQDVAGASVLPS